jgi:S1-C subfamily serine protease
MSRLSYLLVRVALPARPGFFRPAVLAAGTAALLLVATQAVSRADFREAARKLVPATVVITRVEHAEKKAKTSSTKTTAVAPVASDGTTRVDGANNDLQAVSKQLAAEPVVQKWEVAAGPVVQNWEVAAVNVWCGVLIRSDGWIVTSSGGPANAELEVRLTDGRAFPARLVVDDHRTGLWLLKAELVEGPSISLATTPVELGEDVIAATMDGPKSRQIARGIVTGLNRHVDGIPCPIILTDLPVPEAAAGAPVSDAAGELVGLVSARGQGNDKHARVVPAAYVKDLFMSRRAGAVTTLEPGMLGISLRDAGDGKSMAVIGVNVGSPAAKAGLQEGDQVQSIDDRQFKSPEELMEYVGMKSPGSAVLVKYYRGDKDLVAAAVLAARPIPAQPASPNNFMGIVDVPSFFVTNDNGPKTGIQFLWEPAHAPAQAPVIRVEKSDVEKRIDELRHDMATLTSGIESIRSHLDKLGADVKGLTESRNKK